MKKGSLVLKSTFSSYFLVSMLSFWNISLLFNFLELPLKPGFATDFLEALALMFYKLSGFLEWVTEILSL